MSDDNKIRDTVEAVKGVVEAVPVYQDLVQPTAQELGKSLAIVAKTVRVALAPLSAFVWGYEKISGYLDEKIPQLLKGVPHERIITPEANVAVPAIEALRYSPLREQYANLLATAMDSQTAQEAHPAFVEILKQLTPDEARILNRMFSLDQEAFCFYVESKEEKILDDVWLIGHDAGCENTNLVPIYIGNLNRLGITTFNSSPEPNWEVVLDKSILNKRDGIITPKLIVENLQSSQKYLENIKHTKSFNEDFLIELEYLLTCQPVILDKINARLVSYPLTKKSTSFTIKKRRTFFTNMGRQFCRACITFTKKNEV